MKAELDDHVDPWLWTAWELSGEDALSANRIYTEVAVDKMMLLFGIKVYGDSFKPELDNG